MNIVDGRSRLSRGGAAFVVDRQLRYLLAEGEALRQVGQQPADLKGKTIHQAIDLSRQLRPDGVLTGVAMPQLDGIEATARILE